MLSAQLVQSGVPQVVGLDVDAQVLERAKRRHHGIPIQWAHGDLFDIPFDGGSFDAVVSVAMVWPPPETYLDMKRIANRVLPGVRYKRHLLGRYSLIWKKPAQAPELPPRTRNCWHAA